MVVAKISRKDLVPGQHCQMELYNTSDIYNFEFSSSHNKKVKHNKINFNDTFWHHILSFLTYDKHHKLMKYFTFLFSYQVFEM